MHLIPEKKLSKLSEDDQKTVRRLDAWGWFLAGMTHVNFFGWVAGYGLFAASLAESMYKAPIPLVNKIVVGLIAFFQPWTLWAVHFMPIRVGFDISRNLLLASLSSSSTPRRRISASTLAVSSAGEKGLVT